MVEKAHREYDDYKFFHWYDDFQRPRNSITNSHKHKQGKLSQSLTGVQAKALEALNESIDEDEQGDNDSLYEESESETTKDGSDANKNENAKDEIPVQRQPKKRQSNDPTDEILVDLAKKIKDRHSQPKKVNDSIDLFTLSVASELKKNAINWIFSGIFF